MNSLSTQVTSQTIDSREVAEMMGKSHGHLMRDIAGYIEALSANPKLDSLDFFKESSYLDAQGKPRPCYLCTLKGCEMIAHKMTGEKGVQFTAKYINRFHEMAENEANPKKLSNSDELKLRRLEVMEMNAKQRKANLLLKIANDPDTEKIYKHVLKAKATEIISGEKLLPYQTVEQEEYSATEVAEMIGMSSKNAVGKLANQLGLKAPKGEVNEYGRWIHTKSPHSVKEVPSWVYFQAGVDALRTARNSSMI